MSYTKRFMKPYRKRNPNEPEFLQAVKEVLESLAPVFEKKPEYEAAGILSALWSPSGRLSSAYRGWMIRAKCR